MPCAVNGGNGGRGAFAIQANAINVYLTNGKTRNHINLIGGLGGAGGKGGDGTGAFWLPNGKNGADGSYGDTATSANVKINYFD